MRWVEDDADDRVRTVADAARCPPRDLLPPLERYAQLVHRAARSSSSRSVEASATAARTGAGTARSRSSTTAASGSTTSTRCVADVAQQVAPGARHVTFGDPDFFNGVHHALRVVRAVHERFPDLTFDCTVKVEHILRHADVWAELAASGCLFVVSAFESVNDATLELLDKGHTAADAGRAVALLREHGIEIRPSWLPFTPWTTLDDVSAILEFVAVHDLVGNVDPVQYTIRLLVPEGSLLLGHPDLDATPRRSTTPSARPTPGAPLTPRWTSCRRGWPRSSMTMSPRATASRASTTPYADECGLAALPIAADPAAGRPRLTESWFCCAEPTAAQLGPVGRRVP